MMNQFTAIAWKKRVACLLLLTFSTLAVSCRQIIGIGSDSDVPDPGSEAADFSCDQYCDLEFKVCTGPAAQYEDRAACLDTCQLLEQNTGAGTGTQCRVERLFYAGTVRHAPTDLLSYCSEAGPGGGSHCSSATDAPDCEGYCVLYQAACAGLSKNPFSGFLPDDSSGAQADCIEKCRAVPGTSPGYAWQSGKTSGNTLACRLYFATTARVDPQANCDIAGIRPAGPCLGSDLEPSCPAFCLAVTTACTGERQVYESAAQCLAVCNALEPGTEQSIEPANTLACRTAHAFNALLVSANDHCPHASPLGAGVCGAAGNCEAYCALAKAACPEDYAANSADSSDCTEQCAKLDGAEGSYSVKEGQKGGDSVQCRGLAVSRALELPEGDRAAACAAVFGGEPCKD